MNVKALTCPNCGGAIHKYQNFCEYCGSGLDWKEDNPIIRVETFQNPVETLKSRFLVDAEDAKKLGPEATSKLAMESMSRELASQLAQFMTVKNEYDIARMQYLITSEVKVVRPKNI